MQPSALRRKPQIVAMLRSQTAYMPLGGRGGARCAIGTHALKVHAMPSDHRSIPTEDERRYAVAQALANTRLAGHEPTPDFIADCQAVIEGSLTIEQAIAASARRAVQAQALDIKLAQFDPELHGGEAMAAHPLGKEVL